MDGDASRDILPASVNEYVIEYPAATPTTLMATFDLDERFCPQAEHFCAVTWYSFYAEANDCENWCSSVAVTEDTPAVFRSIGDRAGESQDHEYAQGSG